MSYAPWWFESAVNVGPEGEVRVTVACTTTAPEGSVTRPFKKPRPACAIIETERQSNRRTVRTLNLCFTSFFLHRIATQNENFIVALQPLHQRRRCRETMV